MTKIAYNIFILLLIVSQTSCVQHQNIQSFLNDIPDVTVEQIEPKGSYQECHKVLIKQKLDHFGKDTSTFYQKVYVSHLDFSKPVVFVTGGYSKNSNKITELAEILHANQIIVEHRFFGESTPDSLNYKYLNIKQSAEDLHKIAELFKEVYKEKWISTGISKGGQTCLYYRYFYPKDVDVSVPYVAPINFAKEEPRVFTFLENVGTKECRKKILKFQKVLLQNKDSLLPKFEQYAQDNNLTFKMGNETAFEYCVLEFSFAFWQWGDLNCDSIPQDANDLDAFFSAFSKVGFSFFSEEGIEPIRPFFYQALSEIGFYTYDIKPFGKLIEKVKYPNFNFTLPEGINVKYNPKLMKDVNSFLQTSGNNIIYIYGQFDPWSASAVELIPGKTNALKIVKKGGNHKTRINNISIENKEKVYLKLEECLNIKIEK